MRDLKPGEAIFIDNEGNMHTRQCAENPVYSPCIFEHVYFARPDSFIDKISVYKARLRMGETLANTILKEHPDLEIDVVIPIPDTSRTAALELANHLNVKYREGFMKNRYIGRTFIMPGQGQRKKSVRQKLNPIELEFMGKNVLLVYFASAAPAVKYPNVYGIDMPARTELIAHGRTEQEICELIGADALIFQKLEDLVAAAREGNPDIERFDCSVFDGEYVTGDIDECYLDALQASRSDGAKHRVQQGPNLVDLSNGD